MPRAGDWTSWPEHKARSMVVGLDRRMRPSRIVHLVDVFRRDRPREDVVVYVPDNYYQLIRDSIARAIRRREGDASFFAGVTLCVMSKPRTRKPIAVAFFEDDVRAGRTPAPSSFKVVPVFWGRKRAQDPSG